MESGCKGNDFFLNCKCIDSYLYAESLCICVWPVSPLSVSVHDMKRMSLSRCPSWMVIVLSSSVRVRPVNLADVPSCS